MVCSELEPWLLQPLGTASTPSGAVLIVGQLTDFLRRTYGAHGSRAQYRLHYTGVLGICACRTFHSRVEEVVWTHSGLLTVRLHEDGMGKIHHWHNFGRVKLHSAGITEEISSENSIFDHVYNTYPLEKSPHPSANATFGDTPRRFATVSRFTKDGSGAWNATGQRTLAPKCQGKTLRTP